MFIFQSVGAGLLTADPNEYFDANVCANYTVPAQSRHKRAVYSRFNRLQMLFGLGHP